MDNSSIFKTVVIDDETYVIRKFDARTGLKIARLLLAKATPLMPLLDETDTKKAAAKAKKMASDDKIYEVIGKMMSELSDEDVDNLVDKCLRVVSKQMPAGLQPIIDATGHYGVEGIEYDLKLTLRLAYEAVVWGASDFFDGKGLAGLLPQK